MRAVLLLAVCSIACTEAPASPVHRPTSSSGDPPVSTSQPDASKPIVDAGDPPDPPSPDVYWVNIASYLASLYDATATLVHPVPNDKGFSSNASGLVAEALGYLPTPDTTTRDAIFSRLKRIKICGCSLSPGHDALTNHRTEIYLARGTTIPLTQYGNCNGPFVSVPNETDNCSVMTYTCDQTYRHTDFIDNRKTDSCNLQACTTGPLNDYATPGIGKGYADLLAFQILNYKNRGLDPEPLWQSLVGKWDGKGVNDAAVPFDHGYLTYKTALLRISARILGKAVPDGVDGRLLLAQAPNGGIRQDYDLDGKFTKDQLGTAETTAYTVMAFRKPVEDF